jgi:ABC-type sugar transport system substrate-binding protein
MSDERQIFVLLPGRKEDGDHYQLLQEQAAREAGERFGLPVEIEWARAFDQLGVLKKRAASAPVDGVVTEPSTLAATDLVLRELRGRTGLVLLNAWAPSVEEAARGWGEGLPFGTVSTDHAAIGRVQGGQVRGFLPGGGRVLCVTGPLRSSPARERLEGLRSAVGAEIELFDTEAGHWTEAAGITAFGDWYRVFKARDPAVDVVAAQSDELAVGVHSAIEGLGDAGHREALRRAKLLGVDACPGYGKRLVDEGALAGSIVTPSSTDLAIEALHRFWTEKRPVPLRSFTEARPDPPPPAR